LISGAIGPVVRTPRSATHIAFNGLLRAASAAVDMESHIAAAYAAEVGLPFAALRVISDPASRAPPLAERGWRGP